MGWTDIGTGNHICTGAGDHPVQTFIFVPGEIPGTNVTSHLYQIVFTGWIPGINEIINRYK
jgi:hypothetical protein